MRNSINALFDPSPKTALFGLFHIGDGLCRRRLIASKFEVLPEIGKERLSCFFESFGLTEPDMSRLVSICDEPEAWSEIARWKATECPCQACTGLPFQIDQRRN